MATKNQKLHENTLSRLRFRMNSTISTSIAFDYPQQNAEGATCTAQAWAKTPPHLSGPDKASVIARIKQLLVEKDAALIAHYYVDGDIQDLAMETGGYVSDSLEMARFGKNHPAKNLIIAGVRFMGESAKILSPEKHVFMPDLDATCSLDLGCDAADFAAFRSLHLDRVVVVSSRSSVWQSSVLSSSPGSRWSVMQALLKNSLSFYWQNK